MPADPHRWVAYYGELRKRVVQIDNPDTGGPFDLTLFDDPTLTITDETDGTKLVDAQAVTVEGARTEGTISYTPSVAEMSPTDRTEVRGRWRLNLHKTDNSEDFPTEPWEFVLLPNEAK